MKRNGIFLLLALIFAPFASADYYLKFETSGGTFNYDTKIEDTGTASTVKVSIVESPGTDGLVHWPNSRVHARAYVYYTRSNSSGTFTSGSPTTDKLVFYVADVPRSVTVRSADGSTNTEITYGQPVESFPSAPSFLLPDGLLVAAGLSMYYRELSNGSTTSYNKVFMVAAPPSTSVPMFAVNGEFSNSSSCAAGWADLGGTVAIWQNGGYSQQCVSVAVYKGSNRKIIRYE